MDKENVLAPKMQENYHMRVTHFDNLGYNLGHCFKVPTYLVNIF